MTFFDQHPSDLRRQSTSGTPSWFTSALATPVDIANVVVAGARISYRAYGTRDRPGLVLVHGGAAHSRWWDHIAPLLAEDHRVAAVDLSGHGESDWRESYDLGTWAEEVMAVAGDAGILGPPVIVGHSMGGFVTWVAAGRYGASLSGAITIDSPVYDPTPEETTARGRRASGQGKIYPTREAAIAGFRPVPAQETVLPYVHEHLARTSVRRSPVGWGWKYDRRVFASPRMSWQVLKPVECPIALVRCGSGMVSASMGDEILAKLQCTSPTIEIPEAGHHVMLDRPLPLVATLQSVLRGWQAQTAGRTPSSTTRSTS